MNQPKERQRGTLGGVFTVVTLLLLSPGLNAASWNGAIGGTWSNAGNWTGGLPSGNPVLFENTGRTSSATAVGNIVDSNVSITSLSYTNSASLWQVTNINNGITLTITGASGDSLNVGTTTASRVTNAAIQGEGKLFLNQSDASIMISGRSTGSATLDLSGLADFEAILDVIRVGASRTGVQANYSGTLNLAQNSTITASSLLIGDVFGNTQSSSIQTGEVTLGTTNLLSIDQINVGSGRGYGTLRFSDGLESATVVIQGKSSTPETRTRASMNVGFVTQGSNIGYGGIADFTGGEIDAYLSDLNVGILTANSSSSLAAEFSMDAGAVDANSVVIAQKSTIGMLTTGTVQGLLEVSGGNLITKSMSIAQQSGTQGAAIGELRVQGTGSVEVTEGGISMGSNSSTHATISVMDSGKLTLAGDIAKGVGTTDATLTLDGGTLEMNGHNIKVDAFVAASGTLRNVGEVNSGAGWSKTTAGQLSLQGINTYSGDLTVSAGTLLLEGSASQANITVAAGAEFLMMEDSQLEFNIEALTSDSFTLMNGGLAAFDGTFTINLLSVAQEGTWNLLLGTAVESYSNLDQILLNGSLTGALLYQGAGMWQYDSGSWFAEFDSNSGNFSLTAVPEPSTLAIGALGLGMIAFLHKRKRQSTDRG